MSGLSSTRTYILCLYVFLRALSHSWFEAAALWVQTYPLSYEIIGTHIRYPRQEPAALTCHQILYLFVKYPSHLILVRSQDWSTYCHSMLRQGIIYSRLSRIKFVQYKPVSEKQYPWISVITHTTYTDFLTHRELHLHALLSLSPLHLRVYRHS